MKDEIMQRIEAVLAALNNVYVRGKPNLDNLSGSIAILEGLAGTLSSCDIIENVSGEDADPKE